MEHRGRFPEKFSKRNLVKIVRIRIFFFSRAKTEDELDKLIPKAIDKFQIFVSNDDFQYELVSVHRFEREEEFHLIVYFSMF